ncbi:cytochrome P450 [Ruegeria arenilitoris]|uniref:cytochrome P450 n=1 Tax=Ruegeria arenilitoris TaxID=1173585 RepID=UPI001481AA16|nr:cytochrome P450 [Ruegeria arenilitoris]
MKPPKPKSREGRVTLWRYAKLFKQDLLSAQPERLYRAWMAEFRTPFFRSFLINQPELIDLVLKERPEDFPKSKRVGEGLRPLLGNSVFLTNGETWKRQRRVIDPAFEGGRLKDTFPAMLAAAQACVDRLQTHINSDLEFEEFTSHVAADVIFRTLFSVPIDNKVAAQVFKKFKAYQREQPLMNLAAFFPLPHWIPRFFSRETRKTARDIRELIRMMTEERAKLIIAGNAPDDLATKIMTTPDPETGLCLEEDEMVDQVAIFFLAGHETSASALAWTLYLVALNPEWQDRLAEEAQHLDAPDFASVSRLQICRDVFREALRLYPPVPMMVRETSCPEQFRGRNIARGSQIILSPWHLHRHERLWERPDEFDPSRWQTENGRSCQRDAYIPFSTGPRVCIGSGFAMIEGPLILSMLLRQFRFETIPVKTPVPVAHLTVRSKDGIWLRVRGR